MWQQQCISPKQLAQCYDKNNKKNLINCVNGNCVTIYIASLLITECQTIWKTVKMYNWEHSYWKMESHKIRMTKTSSKRGDNWKIESHKINY